LEPAALLALVELAGLWQFLVAELGYLLQQQQAEVVAPVAPKPARDS